jgi:hypothetical protein
LYLGGWDAIQKWLCEASALAEGATQRARERVRQSMTTTRRRSKKGARKSSGPPNETAKQTRERIRREMQAKAKSGRD